jgi:hypothetical protein
MNNYGFRPGLFYKEKDSYNSLIGGIVKLISIALIIAFILIELIFII